MQLFTSGTTAAPKAALLRHANLLSYILGTVEFGSASPDEAGLVCVPPYHIAGIAALMSSIYSMRRILLLPAFDPDAWLASRGSERATNAFVVPTMLARIIARLDAGVKADLSSLQAIAYGGGRMPHGVDRSRAGAVSERRLHECLWPYRNQFDDRAARPRRTSRSTSLHRSRRSCPARLSRQTAADRRDRDSRRRRPRAACRRARRDLCSRRTSIRRISSERKALDNDGWFPTRDAGWIDADGYLFLAGRADDVIVRGGENMSPGEIEDVLMSHPAIADAAAVGVPSVEWGEAVGIAVVAKPRARDAERR